MFKFMYFHSFVELSFLVALYRKIIGFVLLRRIRLDYELEKSLIVIASGFVNKCFSWNEVMCSKEATTIV